MSAVTIPQLPVARRGWYARPGMDSGDRANDPDGDRGPAVPWRIAMLCHGGDGGSTRATLDLAAAHLRRGREVLLLTLGRPAWPVPAGARLVVLPGAERGRRLDRMPGAAMLDRLAAAVGRACRQERVDLLHVHYALPFAAVAVGVGVATVVTLHGGDLAAASRDPAIQAHLEQALARAHAVTTVSAAYRDRAAAVFPRLPVPVLAPNFVAPGSLPRRAARPARPPTIIHLSSFRPVKDARAVARIFLAVRRRLRCRLLLVGDGPDRRGLRALLRGRLGDVAMTGFRGDAGRLLAASDLLLLASRAESFSLAALEAMAAGVPVVAPRVGGLPEVVPDGTGGRLFHPGRAADAVARVLALLRAPATRRQLSASARRQAGRFSEADALAAYDRAYRRALGARARRRDVPG